MNPQLGHAIVAPLLLFAMLLALSGCAGGESTPMIQGDPKSMELTPEEKRAEERDKQFVEMVKQFNQGKPDPGLPPGAIPVSGLEAWASLGNVGKVKLELQKGADINAKFANGATALHEAALNGHVELVRFLLANGADRTLTDGVGATPLELARKAGQDEIVKLLESK
ncbi:MAG: ankyrin repeat domain-containing protein [Planctomycetia bacterium]|nr:ankyrin repeat domain-containing protein [Planctomycetia bacterium]